MNTKDDGGPAFPQTRADALDIGMVHAGMSLRDYFAGQVVQGLATQNIPNVRLAAMLCYSIADEMLEARKR